MLRTDPVEVESRPAFLGSEVPPSGDKARDREQPIELFGSPTQKAAHPTYAYNWSRLTSGRARHAFWLVLLPYTLMNVAGWMLPLRRRNGSEPDRALGPTSARSLDILLRIASGVLTGIFTLFSAAILVDLVAVKCQPGTPTCSMVEQLPEGSVWGWTATMLALAALVTVGGGFFVGWEPRRRRQALRARAALAETGDELPEPPENEPDPVAALTITDPALWHPRDLTRHLILVHSGIAFTAVAWLAVVIGESSTGHTLAKWAPGVATLAMLSVLVATSFAIHGSAYGWLARAAAVLGVASFLFSLRSIRVLNDAPWAEVATADAFAQVSKWLALVVLAIAAAVRVAGISRQRSTAGSAALIVMAGLFGASFGAGVYTLIRSILVRTRAEEAVPPLGGMDWAALGFLVFVLTVVAIALAMILTTPTGNDRANLLSYGLRRVTTSIQGVLGWATLVALGGGILFFVFEASDDTVAIGSPFEEHPDLTRAVLVGLFVVVGLLSALLVARLSRWYWGVGVAALIGVLYVAVARSWLTEINVLGASVQFAPLRDLTVSLALVIPAAFIISRALSNLTNREARRGIGILWDLAGFWPRWYHPFAAPVYTPVAVPDLAGYIRRATAPGQQLVLAAHSQGSMVAAAALLTLDRGEGADNHLSRLALLTYGNPMCHLYARLFPGHINESSVSELSARLGGAPGGCHLEDPPPAGAVRWRNLWRLTDPIGGDIGVPGVSSAGIPDPKGDGHSRYEGTDDFTAARAELMGG